MRNDLDIDDLNDLDDINDINNIESKTKKEFIPLPSSRRKDFWGVDAETIQCEPQVSTIELEHCWIQQGNNFTCIKCSVKHGLFLNPSKYWVLKGSIVDKETGEIMARGVEKHKINLKDQNLTN